MLKIRFYDDKEWKDGFETDGKKAIDPQEQFRRMVIYSETDSAKKAPFRDAESVRMLKESSGIAFVNDTDWYTVLSGNARMPVTAIDLDLQFALAAICLSEQGEYTAYTPAREKVWKVLSELPFDILVAVQTSSITIFWGAEYLGGCYSGIEDVEFQIENYPCIDQRLKVLAKPDVLQKDGFYEKMPVVRKHIPESYLYIGKDGKYYIESSTVGYALQYYWKNDINGIIEYIDSLKNDRLPLMEVRHTYNIYDLNWVLCKRQAELSGYDDLSILQYIYWRNWIREEDYERLSESYQKKEYERYLYFRDTFKVIIHLPELPEEVRCRKLPVMMVDKNCDGTYRIHGSLTVKYPDFDELLEEAIEWRRSDRERLALIVDVEELLKSAKDIEQTVCGFHIFEDSVEIYDKYDAVRLFGALLKEACRSGKYTVDDDFY